MLWYDIRHTRVIPEPAAWQGATCLKHQRSVLHVLKAILVFQVHAGEMCDGVWGSNIELPLLTKIKEEPVDWTLQQPEPMYQPQQSMAAMMAHRLPKKKMIGPKSIIAARKRQAAAAMREAQQRDFMQQSLQHDMKAGQVANSGPPLAKRKKIHNHRAGQICELCVKNRAKHAKISRYANGQASTGLEYKPSIMAPSYPKKERVKKEKPTLIQSQSVLALSQASAAKGTIWTRKGIVRQFDDDDDDLDMTDIRRSNRARKPSALMKEISK